MLRVLRWREEDRWLEIADWLLRENGWQSGDGWRVGMSGEWGEQIFGIHFFIVCMYTHICIYTYIYEYTYIYVVYIWVYIYIYVYVCIYIYVRIYVLYICHVIYTYHIYTRTHDQWILIMIRFFFSSRSVYYPMIRYNWKLNKNRMKMMNWSNLMDWFHYKMVAGPCLVSNNCNRRSHEDHLCKK